VVGVVPQDAHLFHDTIRANLLYARPSATEKELTEACQAARIWELISSLPDGLDTIAGDRGYRFSGGEKQRLALARLLLKAPSVVVLDEATAHLDSESEVAIQRALAIALAGRTSLVIAHRLSTVRAADQILVVDGGQIAERGTHDELLAADGVYAGLYRTRFAPQAALRPCVDAAEDAGAVALQHVQARQRAPVTGVEHHPAGHVAGEAGEQAGDSMKSGLGNLVASNVNQLAAIARNRLERIQHRPALIDGFPAPTGLTLEPEPP
jgi:ABC-type multidrug transport system ATPase subunit